MSGFIPSELGLLTKLTYNLCVRPAKSNQLRTAPARLLHTFFAVAPDEGYKSN